MRAATSIDWMVLLHSACKEQGQQRVAQKLGVSQTTVSMVLAGKYPAGTARIETLVRERLTPMQWLDALRAEVARTSQVRTANRIGVSEATLSQVLSGTYKASTLRVERRVRGALFGQTCECPTLFDPPLNRCQEIQERPLDRAGSYLLTVHACRGIGAYESRGPCPHYNGPGAKAPGGSNGGQS